MASRMAKEENMTLFNSLEKIYKQDTMDVYCLQKEQ